MAKSFGLVYSALSLAALVGAQAPGPDYPLCSRTSDNLHSGWDVLSLRYEIDAYEQQRTALSTDIQNLADGSRIICWVFGPLPRQPEGPVVIEGECDVVWAERHGSATVEDIKGRPASVVFDSGSNVLTVTQSWDCRDDDDGELVTYEGTGSMAFDMECGEGRDDMIIRCYPETLYVVAESPLVIGPADVSVPPDHDPTAPASCGAGEDSGLGWQLLSMWLSPPTDANPGARTMFELRNLQDNSFARCYLNEFDIEDPEEEIVLRNNGASLDDDLENGCSTGWLVETADGSHEWRWQTPVDVSLNVNTHELTVDQVWSCDDQEVEGSASAVLEMECDGSSTNQCWPVKWLQSESGEVKLIGPATLS